jgi:hypothetical protein
MQFVDVVARNGNGPEAVSVPAVTIQTKATNHSFDASIGSEILVEVGRH